VSTDACLSGIGKGVIASSTGLLLKTAGLKVTAIKIDPYMNIDAGTMAPTEHGESRFFAVKSPDYCSGMLGQADTNMIWRRRRRRC
jgi:hypothetical protein